MVTLGAVPALAQSSAQEVYSGDVRNATSRGERGLESKSQMEQERQENRIALCNSRKAQITATMHRMAQRGEKAIRTFTTITDRVSGFYARKKLDLPSYSRLIADTENARQTAAAANQRVKIAAAGFACDGLAARELMTAFQSAQHAQIEALKAYRQTIKQLIIEVKTAS